MSEVGVAVLVWLAGLGGAGFADADVVLSVDAPDPAHDGLVCRCGMRGEEEGNGARVLLLSASMVNSCAEEHSVVRGETEEANTSTNEEVDGAIVNVPPLLLLVLWW